MPTSVDQRWLLQRFSVSPDGELSCLTCGRWWRREGDMWVDVHVGHEPDTPDDQTTAAEET